MICCSIVDLDDYVEGTGWGVSSWGAGTFGSSSALSASNQLRIWTHDNFGEDLAINMRGGGKVMPMMKGGGKVTKKGKKKSVVKKRG